MEAFWTRTASDSELIRQVLRVYGRYAQELVEAFELCPWATQARRTGSAEPHVLLGEDWDDFDPSLCLIERLTRRPTVAVALLIYPRFSGGRLDFEHFARRLRQADAGRHEPGQIPFAMAAFHPEAEPDLRDAERLIPYLRRSPDPTIQLVRLKALEAVRGHDSGTVLAELWMLSECAQSSPPAFDTRAQIARKNLETVRRVGPSELERVFAAIEEDRAATYARLGLPVRRAAAPPGTLAEGQA